MPASPHAPSIEYRPLAPGEESRAVRLIRSVFERHVAPGFSEEGVTEFQRYASEEALQYRLSMGAVLLAAFDGETLAGVAEIRKKGHLGLLFVETAFQHRGVGAELMRRAAELCRSRGDQTMTVNAAPDAVAFYRCMGFAPQSEEQEREGIRFTPMRLALA